MTLSPEPLPLTLNPNPNLNPNPYLDLVRRSCPRPWTSQAQAGSRAGTPAHGGRVSIKRNKKGALLPRHWTQHPGLRWAAGAGPTGAPRVSGVWRPTAASCWASAGGKQGRFWDASRSTPAHACVSDYEAHAPPLHTRSWAGPGRA